jgi:hypothetical protein
MQSFLVERIGNIRVYNLETDRFFMQLFPREGSDFFAPEFEAFRKLHSEPDLTGRKLSKSPKQIEWLIWEALRPMKRLESL